MINSYHNFKIPIPESTTNGLIKSITARPLLQNLLQDVSALSSHVNNMQMVQLACLPVIPAREEYVYLTECSKHVALESKILEYLIEQLSIIKRQNDKFSLAYMNLHGWGHMGGVGVGQAGTGAWGVLEDNDENINQNIHHYFSRNFIFNTVLEKNQVSSSMHLSPFKKVNKTPTNSGTSFYYIVPGYKLTKDEVKKVHSMNFYVKDYTKWVWTKKSSQKPIDKKDISRPHPLGQPCSVKAPIYYDNHICLYRKFVNRIKMGNHVYLYRRHLIKENKKCNRQIAQWRAKERASQKEQDKAWNILQRLK
ncbi:hypothetical protein AMATHDRAFT_8856 [Amanita thiersii Skay4041]|uniref:Uncharacterized protein n=1 Tax=Amanita thiersii Skay4041 TaxID=703135 RepID=A0A2A9NBM2_9AGAR|nr:hypothetical protein AMATHDRAFT_8856 [Amanita thiersii Skay4041]